VKNVIYRKQDNSKELTKEKERLISETSLESARIFIKFFQSLEYAKDLMTGRFYCNTPAFYRNLNFEGIGDTQESVPFNRDYNPNATIDSKPLSEFVRVANLPVPEKDIKTLTVHLFPESFKCGWLHCWLIIDEISSPEYLASLVTDLIRVRKEFGTNFIWFTSNEYAEVTKRLFNEIKVPVRTARVAYSDMNYFHNIACKRLSYVYQREFRFILEECYPSETKPKIYELGDMTDVFHLNEPIKVMINGDETGFELNNKNLYMNPEYFKMSIS